MTCEDEQQNNENTKFSPFSTQFQPPLFSCILFPTKSLLRSNPSLKKLTGVPDPLGRFPRGLSLPSPSCRPRPCAPQHSICHLQPSQDFQAAHLWTHKSGFMVGDILDCLVPYEPLVIDFKHHFLSELLVLGIVSIHILMPPPKEWKLLENGQSPVLSTKFAIQEGQSSFLMMKAQRMVLEARLSQYGIGNRTGILKENSIVLTLWCVKN